MTGRYARTARPGGEWFFASKIAGDLATSWGALLAGCGIAELWVDADNVLGGSPLRITTGALFLICAALSIHLRHRGEDAAEQAEHTARLAAFEAKLRNGGTR